jgi:hypothetical protein
MRSIWWGLGLWCCLHSCVQKQAVEVIHVERDTLAEHPVPLHFPVPHAHYVWIWSFEREMMGKPGRSLLVQDTPTYSHPVFSNREGPMLLFYGKDVKIE